MSINRHIYDYCNICRSYELKDILYFGRNTICKNYFSATLISTVEYMDEASSTNSNQQQSSESEHKNTASKGNQALSIHLLVSCTLYYMVLPPILRQYHCKTLLSIALLQFIAKGNSFHFFPKFTIDICLHIRTSVY